jgi:hypothetical protein
MNATRLKLVMAGLLLLSAGTAEARIKLTTLPERESVRIDIRGARYTLVEEERVLTLQAGENAVDFSWAGTRVHKDTILFRVIRAAGEVSVVTTTYPEGENALTWIVGADTAGPAVVRISYLVDNLGAEPSWQGLVSADESTMRLSLYQTVTNTSGESFGPATVQPGVGRTEVDGFANGARKRLLAARFEQVPVEKRFVYDHRVDREQVRMYYRLVNDGAHGLGAFPLPRGKARLFIRERGGAEAGGGTGVQDEGAVVDAFAGRSQAFLGEDWLAYTPLFGTAELFLGVSKDLSIERHIMTDREVREKTIRHIDLDGRWKEIESPFRDSVTVIRYRLENFRTKNGEPVPTTVLLREHLEGEWELETVELREILGERNDRTERTLPHAGRVRPERTDVSGLEIAVEVPPTEVERKYDLLLTVVRKNRR